MNCHFSIFFNLVITKEGRYATFLIGDIDLRFLSHNEVVELFEDMSFDNIDCGIGKSIKVRPASDLGIDVSSISTARYKRVKTFDPVVGKIFNGIFDISIANTMETVFKKMLQKLKNLLDQIQL